MSDGSYMDKLYSKTRTFTSKKGEIVVTYEHGNKDKPHQIPPLHAINNTGFMRVEEYDSDQTKGMPPGTTQEKVPVLGKKLQLGFALIKTDQNKHTDGENFIKSRNDVLDQMSAMTDEDGNERYLIPGYFTLQFNESLTEAQCDQKLLQFGYTVFSKERTKGYYILKVPTGKTIFEVINDANAKAEVTFSEPWEFGFDECQSSCVPWLQPKGFYPNDPLYPDSWGLFKIKAEEAWNYDTANPQRGRSDVIIVTIDSGAQLNHEDLAGNLENQGTEDWDFTGSGTSPNDSHGQGTAVAGAALSVGNNSKGTCGLANLCKLMPLKIDLSGASPYSDRYNAIMYIGQNNTGKADANPSKRYVMNLSWVMTGDISSIHNAITEAYGNNVLIVAAAGDYQQDVATNPKYPAAYSEVIAVGATASNDAIWDDPNKAPGTNGAGTNYGTRASDGKMVLGAPGVSIKTTKRGGNFYEDRTGSGMACAFVSALGALVWSINKNRCGSFTWPKGTIRTIITQNGNCDNISGVGSNNGKINYRINALDAVSDAMTRAC